MNALDFEARVEQLMGKGNADPGELAPALEGRVGELVGQFVAYDQQLPQDGHHKLLRVAVVGYESRGGVDYDEYAVARSRVEDNDARFRVDVFRGQEFAGGRLVLGSLIVRPPESRQPSMMGMLRLMREN